MSAPGNYGLPDGPINLITLTFPLLPSMLKLFRFSDLPATSGELKQMTPNRSSDPPLPPMHWWCIIVNYIFRGLQVLYWAGLYLGHLPHLPQANWIFKDLLRVYNHACKKSCLLNLRVSYSYLTLPPWFPKTCLKDLELYYLNFMLIGQTEYKIPALILLNSFPVSTIANSPFIISCVPCPYFHALSFPILSQIFRLSDDGHGWSSSLRVWPESSSIWQVFRWQNTFWNFPSFSPTSSAPIEPL